MSGSGGQEVPARIPVLYLAPWVDFGGSDKGTIDWFRWLDRERFLPSLITTQPSDNRRLREIYPFAEEVWALPDLFAGLQFPRFIFDFIHTRGIRLVHIMNSRLGYELLPDLAALPHAPKVVVQLHVEEADRSGYVRYVTTRYGNLVDAFSVTSQHLADTVRGYDIASSKIHVIPTGVDALEEFNPDKVRAIHRQSNSDEFRILFAGRLAAQKDPLLMVEVAAGVAARHQNVRIDVVGDGPLEEAVRARADERGIAERLRLHPPTDELAPWLASSDLVLMTSVFEGVPYVLYEALAMSVPVVAPALPGNRELLGEVGGILIDRRDEPEAYVEAILQLIEDAELRRQLGQAGRARMLRSFSLRQMAAHHETLYRGLAEPLESARPAAPSPPEPVSLYQRPVTGAPLVSVVTPCFNHGRYLTSFFAGIDAQEYPAIEVIIVNDGSTDDETLDRLLQIEHTGRARVLTQPNRGPSVARNSAIAAAAGRYILPVDADNVLLPGAVASLVGQLQVAPEHIGFIYPTFEYFGTRDYRFDPPDYNLFALLHGNFVDTCSLFDRTLFDLGFRFAEDIELGHEDWDLALSLATRRVYGKPSYRPVMRYRKQGFTRSDLVEYLRLPFWKEVQERHPELFGKNSDVGAWGRYRGPAMKIKSAWNPAVSLICAEPVDFSNGEGDALARALERQTCLDFELIAECQDAPRLGGGAVRRLPPGLCRSPADRLQEALRVSRGRYVMLTAAPHDVVADRTTIEKLVRGFAVSSDLDATALVDTQGAGGYPFQLIKKTDSISHPHTLVWRREVHSVLNDQAVVRTGHELADLALLISGAGAQMYWRHFERRCAPRLRPADRRDSASPQESQAISLERVREDRLSPSKRVERKERLNHAPALPAIAADQVVRWTLSPAWMPPETLPLVRHVQVGGSRRIVTNDRMAPVGYRIEFDLGSIQRFSPPGTTRLVRRAGRFVVTPRGSARHPDDEELGHLEEAPLPLFTAIERAVFPDGSETLVVADDRDPMRSYAADREFLGYIEAYPNEPVLPPPFTSALRPVLVRLVDRARRTHRYDVQVPGSTSPSSGQLAAELGTLLLTRTEGTKPLWRDECGHVATDSYAPHGARPDLVTIGRWVLAPANWRGFGSRSGRARAVARRAVDVGELASRRILARLGIRTRGISHDRRLLGYLHATPGPNRLELFAASHPVLDDQFLTHHSTEATDIGYGEVTSLGYIEAAAPITGVPASGRVAVPWASRFGLVPRRY